MENQNRRTRVIRQGGGVYFFGLVGAAIYFIQHASGFWMGGLGILKAMVWPAIFVYKLLDYFKM